MAEPAAPGDGQRRAAPERHAGARDVAAAVPLAKRYPNAWLDIAGQDVTRLHELIGEGSASCGSIDDRKWNTGTLHVMQISAARTRHSGEWVALRLTRTDHANVPLQGDAVAHAADRHALHEMAHRFRARHPEARVFIFFAGNPIPEGLAVSVVSR